MCYMTLHICYYYFAIYLLDNQQCTKCDICYTAFLRQNGSACDICYTAFLRQNGSASSSALVSFSTGRSPTIESRQIPNFL